MNIQQTQKFMDNVYETPDYFISVLFKWDKELQKIKKEANKKEKEEIKEKVVINKINELESRIQIIKKELWEKMANKGEPLNEIQIRYIEKSNRLLESLEKQLLKQKYKKGLIFLGRQQKD
jgi:DNA-directed RNA polymerase beta' subunit